MATKYKALVNIGTDPMIKAGEIFDASKLEHPKVYLAVGQIVAMPEEKEKKTKEVK